MPELPRELEREIFELALLCDRKDAALKLALSLVARRVQFWVDLVFYKMVTISNEKDAEKFAKLIASSLKPPGFFAAVKTLCIPYKVTAGQACAILSACTGVQFLACWIDSKNCPELPLLLCRLPLRRLSVEFQHLLKIPLVPSAWFSNLTHLELVIWENSGVPELDFSTLGRLPSITHVALPSAQTGPTHAAVVCSSCPNLQVLVIIRDPFNDQVEDYSFDIRIVMLDDDLEDCMTEWEAYHFGLPDMWSRAEEVVQKRKL
ncbi:hypothetical protein B0H17DRAFT_1336549 [Mycena rosella]|uniref:F-box domain-containing protein n=1 Tax=Mycena rosella TaxID=1033263 RepID=A0AAD7G4I5_MYCRO|nr:hypothetical protein B0H17DRAFT_1336549 [Mycena rosella]